MTYRPTEELVSDAANTLKTRERLGGKNAGERTRGVETSEKEIPSRRHSMHLGAKHTRSRSWVPCDLDHTPGMDLRLTPCCALHKVTNLTPSKKQVNGNYVLMPSQPQGYHQGDNVSVTPESKYLTVQRKNNLLENLL